MNSTDMLVSIAQIAAGGGIIQAVLAFTRRRSELKQLDRSADSVAVSTADQVIIMLRTELTEAKDEIKAVRRDRQESRDERVALRREVLQLGEEIASLRADLAHAIAEIARLQGTQ